MRTIGITASSLTRLGCLLSLLAAAGWSQDREVFETGGYLKYMPWVSVPAQGAASVNHLIHARLNTAWYPAEEWKGTLEMRFRAITGPSVDAAMSLAEGGRSSSHLFGLDRVLWQSRGSTGFGEIDRMAVVWSPPGAQVSVGRQRIAWGTNLVWNPVDLFNPLSVLDFDYEERPAVDGVRTQWYTGELSKLEGAIKLGRSAEDLTVAGMWSFNVREFDYRLLAGRRGKRGVVGGAWAGDVAGGGFRGEVLAYERGRGRSGWGSSAAISGDYTFPNSLYLHTECLFNTEGVREGAAVARADAVAEGRPSPSRFSLYQEVSMDVSPLVRGSVFAIVNPDDGSRVVVPSISWNAGEAWDVTALLIFAKGGEGTEYGGYGRMYFMRLRYSF